MIVDALEMLRTWRTELAEELVAAETALAEARTALAEAQPAAVAAADAARGLRGPLEQLIARGALASALRRRIDFAALEAQRLGREAVASGLRVRHAEAAVAAAREAVEQIDFVLAGLVVPQLAVA